MFWRDSSDASSWDVSGWVWSWLDRKEFGARECHLRTIRATASLDRHEDERMRRSVPLPSQLRKVILISSGPAPGRFLDETPARMTARGARRLRVPTSI